MNRFTSLLLGLGVLVLAGCDGGGGSGAVGGGGAITINTLTLNTPVTGLVAAPDNNYYSVTLPTAGNYNIVLSGLTNDADPTTYTDSSFSTVTGYCTARPGTLTDTCSVTTGLDNTVIYIKIFDFSGFGANYTLSVIPVAVLAYNTDTPGTVAANGKNFYQVTLPTVGNYLITLTGLTNNVDLVAYSNKAFFALTGICSVNVGTVADTCSVAAAVPNTVVYIQVADGSAAGASYSIKAVPLNTLAFNTATSGSVTANGFSYYQVTLPSAGINQITLSGLTADANPTLFSDNLFLNPAGTCSANTGTTTDICTVITAAGYSVIYMKVTDGAGLGASFTLTATYAVDTLAFNTATAGSVAANGVRYYQVTLPTAEMHYISLSGLTADANPTLFTDAQFLTSTGTCTANVGTVADTCSVTTMAANTVIYIKVADGSGLGASYTLTAAPAIIPLVYNTATPGIVTANGFSLYRVALPTAGIHYISLSGLTADANPTTFTDAQFLTPTGTCTANVGTVTDTCTVATATTYTVIYIKIANGSGVDTSFTLTAFAGTINGLAYNTATAGSVAANGVSYYQVTLPSVGMYLISLTNLSGDANPTTFINNTFTTATGTCTANVGTTADTCTVAASVGGTVIYVKVTDVSGAGATYTLTASPQINTLAYNTATAGSVIPNGVSYYQVTLPTAGTYLIRLTNLSSDANLTSFTDNLFLTTTGTCTVKTGTIPDTCTVTTAAANTVIYIKVQDGFLSGSGATFVLQAGPAPVNEGAAGPGGPLVLMKGVPYAGQVAANGVSYYQANFPSAGIYTIFLSGLITDADITTFTDNLFTSATGTCTVNPGTTADTCAVATVLPNTVIYIKVQDFSGGSGVFFTLTP